MDALGVALVTAGIGVVLGGYVYTFYVQRDLTNRVEETDKNWVKTADDMRKSRDAQFSDLRADTMQAISSLTVSLYDFKLHAATTFATIKSVEQVETNLTAVIDKVETKLSSKLDRLTDMVKNGRHGS